MAKMTKSGTDPEKLWLRFDRLHRDIVLYLVYTEPPVSIDMLTSLVGGPALRVLNAMEALRKRRLVTERRGYGKGLYFLTDSGLPEFAREHLPGEETGEALRKLVGYYKGQETKTEEALLALSRLYLELGDIGAGLEYIKQAADILYRSGQREKAVVNYDNILQYYGKNQPREADADCFLDSVFAKVTISKYLMPLHEQVALLSKAEKVAERHERWEALARTKLTLGRLLQASGRHRQAERCMNDYRNLTRDVGDPAMLKIATLLTSEFLYWQGRFSEAARRYEEVAGDLEEFGDDRATLKAGARVGFSYVICGRIARGMGMIDAVRAKGNSLDLPSVVAVADFMSALALMEMRKLPEAELQLDRLSSFPDEVLGHYTLSGMNRCRAYISCAREDYSGAYEYHKRAIEHSLSLGWSHHNGPWNLECLDILESKGFFNKEWNFDGEVRRILGWDDIYMKGVAYRYRALRNMKSGRPLGKILTDLKGSEKYLKEAGAEIELARTWVDLGNAFAKKGEPTVARAYLEKAWALFSTVDRNLIPKDLLVIMPQEAKIELMIERIMKINESLGTIQDMSSFLERVINAAMDFTMATRGAFFAVGAGGEPKIMASRNLDVPDARQSSIIHSVVAHGDREGIEVVAPGIKKIGGLTDQILLEAGIYSFICMPAKLVGQTQGYLYLDNRLGGEPFSGNLLTYVRLLCSQIAVGLSNIKVYDEMRKEKDRLEDEAIFYKQTMGIANPPERIMGTSGAIKTIIEQIRQVAPTDSTVLIVGETGVGKELVAKAIHHLSERREGPFIPVNLAVLPHDLVASELFGHEKGSFTGASERHKGRFELADGGTIFLDEIGDLPPDVQVKLLRVLQESKFERLGSERQIRSDFRVVAATHRNLHAEIEKGAFRQDLYYRLNVFPLYIPPLRDRKEDIPLLAHHFLDKFGKKMGKRIGRIPEEELAKLIDYHWPGNVRELEHFVERAVIISDGHRISFSGHEFQSPSIGFGKNPGATLLADVEREHIEKVLKETRGKVGGPDGAASILGLKPTTLFFRMKKLGITKRS